MAYCASSRDRKKIFTLVVLCFGFTFAVRTFQLSYVQDDNELIDSVKLAEESVLKYRKSRGRIETVWTYKCHEDVGCLRELRNRSLGEAAVEQDVCWLNCGPQGSLWPYPTGKTVLGRWIVPFQPHRVVIKSSTPSTESQRLLQKMHDLFEDGFEKKIPEDAMKDYIEKKALGEIPYDRNTISININVLRDDVKISLGTNESYSLSIVSDEAKYVGGDEVNVEVEISAETIFGARHALESLSQLLTFDQQNNCFQVIGSVEIEDSPAFTYRGFLMDTARTFIPIPDLKRMIDAMSYNKLNMFHWHLTDSNSFPFFSKRVPQMTQYGAYSESKIYYPEDVRDLIQYATVRGIKIIPELDAPAHAGNGWEWGPSSNLGDLAVCINAVDWRAVCGQPPCGQLNPTNVNVYIILEKLYKDMLEEFDDDIFHMGGDEVFKECWERDPIIVDWMKKEQTFNYLDVWGFFQTEAFTRLKKANSDKLLKPILWTSTLTETPKGRRFLNSSLYIIQVWENGRSPVVPALLKENYQLIISNNDVMYLDHGAGTWLGRPHIYEYKQWQVLYDNSLKKILVDIEMDKLKPVSKRQILGGEATLWAEKVNSHNMDSRTWPRTSAVAENLWSDPPSRSRSVYSRLLLHTKRMIQLGIGAEQLQPESCSQLTGHCEDPQSQI